MLPRITGGALGHGCDGKGSGALPLPRAAVISTGLRVLVVRVRVERAHDEHEHALQIDRARR